MAKSTSFRINSPKVVRETIDGEVVIVNLDKGHYYSLVKAGADIWDGIERGISRDNLIEEIAQQYDGSRADIENAVNNFIERLQQEELIVFDKIDASKSTNSSNEQTKTNASKEKVRFEPPTLVKYTDMEDLLTLDPIHDVDETGWPNTKQEYA